MISELTNAQSIRAKLLSSQGDAEIVNELNTIVKTEWNVSAAMFKRGFKCLTLHLLKYGEWPAFSALKTQMCETFGWTNVNYQGGSTLCKTHQKNQHA